MKTIEYGVHTLIKPARYAKDVVLGGPRLLTVSRDLGGLTPKSLMNSRGRAALFFYLGADPYLIASWHPTERLAGKAAQQDIQQHEQQTDYLLNPLGYAPYGILYSRGGKLSMISIDLSQKFMDEADIPKELLLPKRVPSAIRIGNYWQLWLSL